MSTKAGLAGGTVYLYYEAGLWKGTDETIENYAKLCKDAEVLYNSNPDVKKWTEYVTSSVTSTLKPYTQVSLLLIGLQIIAFYKSMLVFHPSTSTLIN